MAEKIRAKLKRLDGSSFRSTSLSRSVFDDVSLSGARFHNIDLRRARFSAVDFGGARFSCVNTGEGRPRKPVVFTNVELDKCRFRHGSFAGVSITGAKLEGMRINGVLVTQMIKAWKAARRGK
jgi:uncharacterized protein YjbI with pentapeptide repeats